MRQRDRRPVLGVVSGTETRRTLKKGSDADYPIKERRRSTKRRTKAVETISRLQDRLSTETTAPVQDPISAQPNGRGNGQAHHNGGNGHRRVRHHIRDGYRHAAEAADTALLLVEAGMTATEAIRRCSTNTNAYAAMKAIVECGSAALHAAVLKGGEPFLAAGSRVRNAAAAISAFRECSELERALFLRATGATNDPVAMLLNLTPDQLIATSKALGFDWVWDKLIAPAMETEPVAETTTETDTHEVNVEVVEAAE
jgi:hypothetical protein